MKYWWVNHKMTHSEEIEGSFLWSPETAKDGSRRQTYINLTRTSPGDIVFSYANMRIAHIGVVNSAYSERPRPSSLDKKNSSWADTGWYVPVKWLEIEPAFKPKPHIDKIWPLLPPKHYPLREDGNGVENCYLAEISGELATLLCQLCYAPIQNDPATQQLLADVEQTAILSRPNAGELEKDALVKARRGQGKFKENLRQFERKCRLTGTKDPRFLIASHIKPWAVSDDTEKLDGNNGLLLAPHVDKLFDGGYITFTDSGAVICSEESVFMEMEAWGMNPTASAGAFTLSQSEYLSYHRQKIFRGKLPKGTSTSAKNDIVPGEQDAIAQ